MTWYNGFDYTFTWKQGTQLASATKGSVTTTYDYDMSGVRSRKTVGSTTYDFATLSGLVMRQTWDGKTLDFVYDDSNQPYALVYKSSSTATPVLYYYVLNQQGDVMALMNTSGTIVAQYQYDPWGVPTVVSDTSNKSIATLNPLRYRGYYYDTETGFYYLQSRYYDPANARFISADKFATTDCEGFLSANMFAYCENNPVNCSDSEGKFPVVQVAAAVIGGGINLATSWASAKATGQSFNVLDGVAAFAAGAIGTLTSGVGRVFSTAISGLYTTYSIIKSGGSVASGIACGALSAGITYFSFSNLAKFTNKMWSQIGYKAVTDLSFGWGGNMILAGMTSVASKSTQNNNNKATSPTSYQSRYPIEDRIRWKYYAEHYANRREDGVKV